MVWDWINVFNRSNHWHLRYVLWFECLGLLMWLEWFQMHVDGFDQYDAMTMAFSAVVYYFWSAIAYLIYKVSFFYGWQWYDKRRDHKQEMGLDHK